MAWYLILLGQINYRYGNNSRLTLGDKIHKKAWQIYEGKKLEGTTNCGSHPLSIKVFHTNTMKCINRCSEGWYKGKPYGQEKC